MRFAPRTYDVRVMRHQSDYITVRAWSEDEAQRVALSGLDDDWSVTDVDKRLTCHLCGYVLTVTMICPEHGEIAREDAH